jgi:hypothetical protein
VSVSAVSHATITAFREAVIDVIRDAFPDVACVPGRIDGPSRNRDVNCVWPVSRVRVGDHALEENMQLGIRCWKRWQDQKDPDRPIDPEPLEWLSESVLAALGRAQTSLGTWMIDVQGVQFDTQNQGIEVVVLGRQWNPFGMCEEDV